MSRQKLGNILTATHRYVSKSQDASKTLPDPTYAHVKDKHDCLPYKQRPTFGLRYTTVSTTMNCHTTGTRVS